MKSPHVPSLTLRVAPATLALVLPATLIPRPGDFR